MTETLCSIFQDTVAKHGALPAVASAGGSVRFTWQEYGVRVRHLAGCLHALGVRRGDIVGLVMTNRPEFHLVDMAVLHLGATPFSVYNTSSAEQIAYLFSNAENRVVVCDEQFETRVREASTGSKVEHIVLVEELDLLAPAEDFSFEETWRSVGPEDVATIIYTSGTTGPPKGVELTHANVVFSIRTALAVPEVVRATEKGRVISYLPDAHLANRWFAYYVPMAVGGETTTLADPKQLAVTLQNVRPTAFLGVPMVWYKLKAAIDQAVAEQTGVRGAFVRWALAVGARRVEGDTSARTQVEHTVAERLVLRKLRHRIGLDQVIEPATGAAPISVDALKFFLALGIPLAEGWGMSETCLVGTLNRTDAVRPGTVGTALPGVELTIAEDGELLLRSPGVMRGYRNDPEKTAEALGANGWLHTGDIASIDDDGYVRIVDRKKELIINAAGKNMSPSNIEAAVKVESGLIGSVVVIGDRRPYVVALLTLDQDAAAGRDRAAVDAELADAVERANSKLSRVEQIKKFAVLERGWLPGGDELTPTMKLKRKPIAEKYADEIEELYR